MHVLLINTLYPPDSVGGAERSVSLIARGLARLGVRVSVLCLTREEAATTHENGITVMRRPLRNLYWAFGTPRTALKYAWHAVDTYNPLMAPAVTQAIEQAAPDIVHTHNLSGFSVSAWRAVERAGMPLVHTLRDTYLLCPRYLYRGGRACTGGCLDCRVVRRPHVALSRIPEAVIGTSRYVLNAHVRAGYFNGVQNRTVIGNPVDCETPGAQHPAHRDSGIVRFGYLGRLDPSKGIELLLAETESLPAGRWQLRIAGRGAPDYEKSLRNGARPEVEFLGWVEPDALFSRIDVLVVPSLLPEAFGRGVIEANARGIPVVVSDRGSLPELVEVERTGLSFNPDRPGDLGQTLRAFVDGPLDAGAMAHACREAARSYTADRIAQQHLAVYESLAERHAGNGQAQSDKSERDRRSEAVCVIK